MESEESGPKDTLPDENGHPPVISFLNANYEALAAGPTVYTDISFDTSGENAKLCTAEKHDGKDTFSRVEENTTSLFVNPLESSDYAGEDPTAIDGHIPSGVDDKVGTVETAGVAVHSTVYLETKYGDTCTGPNLDEETGSGVYKPDAEKPGVKRVHITDGGEAGESEPENPNVVVVKTWAKGCNAYLGHVKNKTTNLPPAVNEHVLPPFVNEILGIIEGHEGPHYPTGTEGEAENMASLHTACDYDCEKPEVCK